MPLVRRRTSNLILGLLSLFAGRAEAQSSPSSIDVSATIGVTSDYRFRGISLSNRRPALQGGVDIALPSGLFVGSWASTISLYGGSRAELDIYGGYGTTLAGTDLTGTIYGYGYIGGHGVSYVELQGTATHMLGGIALQLEVDVAPHQSHAPGNLYLGAGLVAPIADTGISLSTRIGHEDGGDDKWDWEAGVSCELSRWTLSASYVDSNYGRADRAGRLGSGAVMASVKTTF